MKRKWLTVAIISCVIGIICASESLRNFYRIFKSGVVAGDSFCAISDFVNCDVVEASSYSNFNGIPIAGLGLIYYILILIFISWARFSRGFKKPTVAFAWWSTIPAVLYSIVLLYISVFILHALCLTCIGMYLVNVALFISLYLAMRIPINESLSFFWGYWLTILARRRKGIDFMPKFFIHLLASIIIFAIGLVFISSASSNIDTLSDAQLSDYLNDFYRQSRYDIKFDKDSASMWGTKNAPVTVVEFSDYRCPFCKLAAFTIKPFLVEYRDDVAYYFLNYPLDSTCNHYMQHQMHPGACLAAKGGICADKLGKFWEYHDTMFKSDEQIDVKLLEKIAKKLNLNKKILMNCVRSAETDRKLKREIESARRIFITGTPSIFINNRHLKFWRNPAMLREVVKREIEASKKSR